MRFGLRKLFDGTNNAKLHVAPSSNKSLVGVGHSHLIAVERACAARRSEGLPAPPETNFIQMLAPEFNKPLSSDGTLNKQLAEAINALLDAQDSVPFLFECISGNEYHFLGLVNHPRPFDFVLPSQPGLPLQAGAELIPSHLMRDALRAQMGLAIATMSALRAAVTVPIWHVQSPPPLPDNDFIRMHPISFADQIAERGVSPALFRLKLWLLQSEIYRSACDENGIHFLGTPEDALDESGFLREPGWQPDPVHANAWYGELVLTQLEAIHTSLVAPKA